jgi:heptosyltransferase-2
MKLPAPPKSILLIQTAFLGDVILATALIEKLHSYFPESKIDFLLRKGNDGVLANNPGINRVLVWDKQQKKYRNLFRLLKEIRKTRYDLVVNTQRFFATGFLTAFSRAKRTIGFDKNPLSFLFSEKVNHAFEGHEVSRNLQLIAGFTSRDFISPRIYPSASDEEVAAKFINGSFICIAPASVWFTKQYPKELWIEMINDLPADIRVFLLGSKQDIPLCEEIVAGLHDKDLVNILAGKLSITQTAALMKRAQMNFVNDSAPMHIASAINAPVTAVYCSTIPAFGFGPLSDVSFVVEKREPLYCRPCGLHGYNKCPEGHFRCAYEIDRKELLDKMKL